jgi:Domain of unknown function (DUF6457)
VHQWLTRARDALADAGAVPADELVLDDAAAATLLDLASVAAHDSGARTNAPLLCYLIGRAERTVDLDTLANAVRDVNADVDHTSKREEP